MEKEEKSKQELNAENAAEQQQPEAQNENVVTENTEGQQKENHLCRRVVIFLVLAALVGVAATLITKSCHKQNDYGYEYGEEPTDGYVSYDNGKSNIIAGRYKHHVKTILPEKLHHGITGRSLFNRINSACQAYHFPVIFPRLF